MSNNRYILEKVAAVDELAVGTAKRVDKVVDGLAGFRREIRARCKELRMRIEDLERECLRKKK